MFKLVQYQTSDPSNGAGYCTFTTELTVDPAVRSIVEQDIKSKRGVANPVIAPLLYEDGGSASFTYPDPKTGDNVSTTVKTSALGDNRAAFLVQLNPEQAKVFIEQYSQKGNKGYPVQYVESVDGVTPAITIDISFDATTVRTYEDKVTTHTWSADTHDITDKVKTEMPKDQNYVTVTPGSPKPSDAVINKLKDWGQGVLDAQITKMIQTAQELKKKKQTSTWTRSFYRKYQQNQVIPWNINPVAQVESPVTDQMGWSQFFETVDIRQFVLQVTMNVDDRKLDADHKVKSITVNVDYPGLNSPNNSAILTSATNTHTFTSPIAPGGNLEYNLNYVVTYGDNSQLTVTRNGLHQSAYTIAAPDVGILNVKFDTSQIEFVDEHAEPAGVHGLEVDLFYKDLSGMDNPIEQKILFGFPTGAQKDGHPVYEHPLTYTFQSKTSKPLYNGYVYTQKFIMSDGSIVVADPITSNANLAFGADGTDDSTPRDNVVYLNSSVSEDTFDLYYFPPTKDNDVRAFQAKVNQVQGDGSLKFVGQTNISKGDHSASFKTTTLNPGNQPYSFEGTIVTGEGPIRIAATVNTNNYRYLYNDKRFYSVELYPALIKFKDLNVARKCD